MSDEILKGFAQAATKIQEAQKDIDQEFTRQKKGVGSSKKPERKNVERPSEETKGGEDDVYHKRPQQQNYRTNQRRGYDNTDQNQTGEWRGKGQRGRGNYRGNYQKFNQEGDREEGEEGRTRSYRGRGGRGGYRDNEQDGDGEKREYRGRGRGRGGYERGRGRGGYQRDFRTDKQKQPEESESDGLDSDELTLEQQQFIATKKEVLGEQLKGLVNENQIGRRCIDLNFSETRLQEWVDTLVAPPDKRVQGCKDFEWNDTVTPGEKRANRAKKINDFKNKKAYAEEKKRKHEEWKQRQEEKKKRQEEWEARKAEREAKKEEKRKLAEENEMANKKDQQENVTAAAVEEAEAEQPEDETQVENGNDKQFEVKAGGQTLVYKQKNPKEKAEEASAQQENEEEEEADQAEEEYDDEEYDDEDYDDEQEVDPAIAAIEDEAVGAEQLQRKDSEKAESELLHEVATQQQREHEERVQREKEETERKKKAELEKKNQEEDNEKAKKTEKSKKEEETATNPLSAAHIQAAQMNAAMMMPNMMPQMPNLNKPADSKDGAMPQQTPTVLSAYDAYTHMMFHQQMAQHYQTMFTQQMALQQHLANNQGGNTDQNAAMTQFMQQQQLGFPMAGLPTAGLSGLMQPTNGQGPAEQQQLGMMPQFMPMMYPMAQGGSPMNLFGGMQFPNQQNQGQSSGKDEAQ